jgi:hypothetical protein
MNSTVLLFLLTRTKISLTLLCPRTSMLLLGIEAIGRRMLCILMLITTTTSSFID